MYNPDTNLPFVSLQSSIFVLLVHISENREYMLSDIHDLLLVGINLKPNILRFSSKASGRRILIPKK